MKVLVSILQRQISPREKKEMDYLVYESRKVELLLNEMFSSREKGAGGGGGGGYFYE